METFWARNQKSFAIVKPDIYKILIKRWIFDDSDKIEITGSLAAELSKHFGIHLVA